MHSGGPELMISGPHINIDMVWRVHWNDAMTRLRLACLAFRPCRSASILRDADCRLPPLSHENTSITENSRSMASTAKSNGSAAFVPMDAGVSRSGYTTRYGVTRPVGPKGLWIVVIIRRRMSYYQAGDQGDQNDRNLVNKVGTRASGRV
ncbi:hypothetical protein C8R44DRAFT_744643 [Mycena epipterygia]|nr:hypothetical protein C8R44DRAFT_744643 [Mycena epipterygia]